jgi:uncharacterized membrane protein
MFMVTLGDVFGIIIFLALVGYLVYFFVSGRKATKFVNDQKSAKREEAHKDSVPKRGANDKVAYIMLAVFLTALAVIFFLIKK